MLIEYLSRFQCDSNLISSFCRWTSGRQVYVTGQDFPPSRDEFRGSRTRSGERRKLEALKFPWGRGEAENREGKEEREGERERSRPGTVSGGQNRERKVEGERERRRERSCPGSRRQRRSLSPSSRPLKGHGWPSLTRDPPRPQDWQAFSREPADYDSQDLHESRGQTSRHRRQSHREGRSGHRSRSPRRGRTPDYGPRPSRGEAAGTDSCPVDSIKEESVWEVDAGSGFYA